MKHFYLLALLCLLLSCAFAQNKKQTEYAASNGKTYHVGDTIKLGRGSDPQGNFKYVVLGGWTSWLPKDNSKGAQQDNMGRTFTGAGAIIKKMRIETTHKVNRQVFVVGIGALTNCDLYIEDAIGTCEVADCKGKTDTLPASAPATPATSNADELAKYKKLFDQGAITKGEYEAMKKKLLGL